MLAFLRRYWKPQNVYDALKPLHLTTKLMGLSSYKYVQGKGSSHNDEGEYETSPLGICYSYSCTLLFVGYYIFAVEERNKIDYVQNNTVANTIEMYQLYGAVVVMTICSFCNSLKQNVLIKALKSLSAIDAKLLNRHQSAFNYFPTRNRLTIRVFFVFALFGALEFMNCSMFLRGIGTFSTFCIFMCYIPSLIICLVEFQFITYVLLLKQRFTYLNSELSKLTRSDSRYENQMKTLSFMRTVHWELCHVGRSINDAFHVQLLLIICNVFVSFTSLGYYSFDGFVRLDMGQEGSNLYDCVTTTIWTLVKLLQILVITVVCTNMRIKANAPKEILYKIRERFRRNMADEITQFSCQMLHWNFRLTAFDFFDIDMTLFYSVVGSATTYLMILLQLDSTNRQLEGSNN